MIISGSTVLSGIGSSLLGYYQSLPLWFTVIIFALFLVFLVMFIACLVGGRRSRQWLEFSANTEHVSTSEAWCHLIVKNVTKFDIGGVYGTIDSFKILNSQNRGQTPIIGLSYPWSSHLPHKGTLAVIPAGKSYPLDIAFSTNDQEFYTPTLVNGYTRQPSYPLPNGVYEVNIKVGAEFSGLKPYIVKMVVVFLGNTRLSTHEMCVTH